MKISDYSIYFFTQWLSVVIACFILSACSSENPKKADSHVMVKDTPENKVMLKAFKEQENRLELNGCEYKYNGASFRLGSDIDEVKKVFGNSLLKKPVGTPTSPTNINAYFPIDDTFILYEKDNSGTLESFVIFLDDLNENDKFILINGIPIDKTMKMKEFVDNSKYEFSDFSMANHAYYISFDQCDRPIEYELTSDVPLTYSGGGHLMFKDGGVNLENTKPVESLYISYID